MNTAFSNYANKFRLAYANSRLPAFLRWWGGELDQLLPQSLRSVVHYRAPRLAITRDQDEIVFWRCGAEGATELARRRLDEGKDLASQELARLQARFDDPPKVVLAVPASKLLRRQMSFPAAAEENLRQVLGFEMDRQTPFRADHVYYDHRVVARYPETRMIQVELVLVPRPVVDELLKQAAKRGIQPDVVDVFAAGDGGPGLLGINLLPAEKRGNGSHRRRNLNLALAVLVIALAGTAMWQSLGNKQQVIDTLNNEISAARGAANQARALRDELEDAVDAANFLVQKKESHPSLVDILREVTHALPDDTSLQRFQIRDGELQLQGESASTGPLLRLLGQSPMLHQADFNGVTSVDQKTGKERFNIKAQVTLAGGDGGPSS